MKIAFYMTTVLEQLGGFEKSFIEIANGLKEYTDIEVELITMNEKLTANINKALSLYFQKNLTLTSEGRESSEMIKKLISGVTYRKFDNFKSLKMHLKDFDIIYSKNEIIEAFVFKYILKYRNLPPIVFLCGTAMFYPKPTSIGSKLHNLLYSGIVYKHLASGVKGFHTKNKPDINRINKIFPGRFCAVIPNPFNFEEMDFHQFDNKLKLDQKKYNILWAARLTEQKGLEDLASIIADVNKSIESDVEWWIAGEGEDRKKIETAVENNKNVHLLGHVSSMLMPTLYQQSQLFITTSKWESFGNTIVEAGAYNTPTIAFNISGPNEIIMNGKNGILVEDANEFVDTIISVVEGNIEFNGIQQYIRNKYGTRKISLKLASIFETFMKQQQTNKDD